MKNVNVPKFHRADGSLNTYALSCGYIERATYRDEQFRESAIELYHDGACYHVRQFDGHERRFWYSYDTYSGARARYDVATVVIRRAVDKHINLNRAAIRKANHVH